MSESVAVLACRDSIARIIVTLSPSPSPCPQRLVKVRNVSPQRSADVSQVALTTVSPLAPLSIRHRQFP
ncbi:hypothetical protein BD309DRAFT_973690 [Dichomitus squalens]|nr:hypothetical protein BD309DRAFT_973690 [Dichomitus squalens]